MERVLKGIEMKGIEMKVALLLLGSHLLVFLLGYWLSFYVVANGIEETEFSSSGLVIVHYQENLPASFNGQFRNGYYHISSIGDTVKRAELLETRFYVQWKGHHQNKITSYFREDLARKIINELIKSGNNVISLSINDIHVRADN